MSLSESFYQHRYPKLFWRFPKLIFWVYAWNQLMLRRVHWVKSGLSRRLKNSENCRVLEIGFGEGVFLTWAQKKFPQHSFEGWDRDRANVEFVGKLNAHLKLKCADADTEPLENESYDLVLIAGVLQYVKQDFELLLRLNQCLKTGGVIQIYTPIEAHVVFKGIDRLYQKHRNYEKAQGLQRVYRYTEVVELLKNAGFQVIRQVFTYGRVATAAHEWYRFCLQQMGIGRLWAVLALAATWWLVAVLIRLDSGKPPNGLWIEAVKLND